MCFHPAMAPKRLLVVEDNPKHASFLSRALVAHGFEVELAAVGGEALTLAMTRTFDLVLLDWMIPGIDGLGVCRLLRQNGRSVPVLMLTVRDEREAQVAALEAGADNYVTKPYDMEVLLARVHALTRRAAWGRDNVLEVGSIVVRARD